MENSHITGDETDWKARLNQGGGTPPVRQEASTAPSIPPLDPEGEIRLKQMKSVQKAAEKGVVGLRTDTTSGIVFTDLR